MKMHAQEKAPLDAAPLPDRVTLARAPPTYVSRTLFSPDRDAARFFDTCSISLPDTHSCVVRGALGVSKRSPEHGLAWQRAQGHN